jgi:transposase-like protein
MRDHNRENVLGLTAPEFDHVGTSTLRYWRDNYWKPVLAGNRSPDQPDHPRQAREMIAKLAREIDERESRGLAGPERDTSWQTL